MKAEEETSVKSLLKEMKATGAHIMQATGRRANKTAVYTILLVENPDEVELADIEALQQKWEGER